MSQTDWGEDSKISSKSRIFFDERFSYCILYLNCGPQSKFMVKRQRLVKMRSPSLEETIECRSMY